MDKVSWKWNVSRENPSSSTFATLNEMWLVSVD